MKAVIGFAISSLFLLPVTSHAKMPQMGLDFSFEKKHKCGGISPEIRLTDVPPGVATYEIRLMDLDMPSYRHWYQKLPADGPIIKEGAGAGYDGPCPPSGTHRYEIEITARDGQGKPIAEGARTVNVER